MQTKILLYGSTGYLGSEIARKALEFNLEPILAGRNPNKIKAQAAELGLEYRAFGLEDHRAVDSALKETPVVLHCAGPYKRTFKPMLHGCLLTRPITSTSPARLPCLKRWCQEIPKPESAGL